ncbi:MAG: hypothetical protein KJO05_00330 [Bacteroidia bacterium]|nr:hypothetical protein [Bacteroidia bacterium]NNF30850.1 hypothetical protein [Flavobacteriaceae bacterium]MBT8275443.1 hypothetical protein [Bacteroidia bacterium]NNJ82527.1 hypothetical protein [Flavobacteriaceae bacterium]NNK54463.1 hypothetical protein [Flavobacteriaceae bacterium]
MKKVFLLFISAAFLWSCSSSRLIDQWESPDTPVYESNKILVIGMSADTELRRTFEDKLASALEKEKIVAVRSIDFFERSFTDTDKTEEDLNTIENQLIESGFDSVLISKVTGTEAKVTTVQAMRGFVDDFQNFKDYYRTNQDLYRKNATESYTVYHTETSIFCICPGEEREMLWRGNIDVVDPYNRERNINDYVRTLLKTLEKNELVIVRE